MHLCEQMLRSQVDAVAIILAVKVWKWKFSSTDKYQTDREILGNHIIFFLEQ